MGDTSGAGASQGNDGGAGKGSGAGYGYCHCYKDKSGSCDKCQSRSPSKPSNYLNKYCKKSETGDASDSGDAPDSGNACNKQCVGKGYCYGACSGQTCHCYVGTYSKKSPRGQRSILDDIFSALNVTQAYQPNGTIYG